MPFAPVTVPPGVVRPATPLQAKGRWWDANLVRWQAGKLLPVGGWQRITAAPLDSTVRLIFPWSSTYGGRFAVMGADEKLYNLDGPTFDDITPPLFVGREAGGEGGYSAYLYDALLYGSDTDPLDPRPQSQIVAPSFAWTIDNWGGEILACASSDGRLLHYAEGNPTALPVGYRALVAIDRTSNVVTGLCLEAHDFSVGRTITINGVTDTSFNGTFTITAIPTATTFEFAQTGADASSTGGYADSGVPTGNRGTIVTQERHAVLFGCGGNMRRVAWSSREDYTDWDFANPSNTAGFIDLETTGRIIMAAPVREGVLLWTDDEAWLMRYTGLPYVYGIDRIGYGCGLIAPQAFVTTAGRCIWMGREGFWIYDGGFVKPLPCDVGAYVFEEMNATTSSLYAHGAENNIFPEAWFWYCSSDAPAPDRYVVYNYAEGWWSIGEMPRTACAGAGLFPYPLAAGTDDNVFEQENGWTAAGDSLAGTRFAETGALNIRQGDSVLMARQALTDSGYGYDSTTLTFFASLTPEGAETTSGPYAPRSDGYTDVRFTGRDFRMRVAATQDAPWSIGETRLDLVPRGGR